MRFPSAVVALSATLSFGQTVAGFDPHVYATPTDGGLLLRWNALANSGPVTIRRQEVGAVTQTTVAVLDAGATSWVQPLDAGARVLLRVQRTQQAGSPGESVLLAGLEAPFPDDQGLALVLIDDVNAPLVRANLDVFEADLRDDGFVVVEQVVPRAETPPAVKARIAGVFAMAAGRPLHVVLLGAVPRAYSGVQAPDGHPDHRGAWPADPYYADLSGLAFTDTGVGGVGAFHNDAGDGKFDQSFTSSVECAVGRVDFQGMPAFGADAGTVQLGRYLDTVHRFRTGAAPLPRRALVRPTFGYFSGEAFGRAGYRDATAILGVEADTAPFFPALESDGGVLLAWGDGPGGPTSAGGVTSTSELAMRSPQTRFMGLFGSYFGDWNYTNNLLRAALGSGETVASLWYARPQVQLFALGGLESFGQSFSRDTSFRFRGMPVYQALLGDPTLRIFYPRKLGSLAAAPQLSSVTLSWTAFTGPEPLVGYHVYRSASGGVPTRLTGVPTRSLTFSDATVAPSTTYSWRVVAVVREATGSGTFWNHSLGARASATTLLFDAGVPAVDAGVPVDAGVRPDAGTGADAGPPMDAGMANDAGAEMDAGMAFDAGEADAGAEVDAGVALDAGQALDSGVTSDAGTDADAGSLPTPLPVDPMDDPMTTAPGCRCDSSAGFSVGVLLVLAGRRRHKRSSSH